MKNCIGTALVLGLWAGAAAAAPINLSSWQVENYSNGAGSWTLATDNNSVTQSLNGNPTVFHDNTGASQGNALSGSITVNTSSDDDYVGFVLGFDDGELDGTATNVDYWLIDWKQGNQGSGGRFAQAGLSLTHVTDRPTAAIDFWDHGGSFMDEVQRGATLGSTGWGDGQTNTFELVFTDTLIEVSVNGTTELSYTSTEHGSLFGDGGFGFYNYSQNNVTYAGIQQDALPDPDPDPMMPAVPLPASAWLLFAGLGGLVGAGRFRRT